MKLGILGTGKIVKEALTALEPIDDIQVTALFHRPHSLDKAMELGHRFGIPALCDNYDEMLTYADVDTIYIGLINSVHFEYAKKALENDKNVILEKPFVGTYEEAEILSRLAKEHNCFLFEAITVLHNDVFYKIRQDLPKIGTLKMVIANYSQYSSRYDRYLNGDVDYSFDPDSLGGALRDINVYNIHYVVALFGLPDNTMYFPNRGFNGIDTSGTLVMTYPDFTAVCVGAKDSDSPCFLSIQGEKGYIRIEGKPNSSSNITIVSVENNDNVLNKDSSGAIVRTNNVEHFTADPVHHRMTKEFRDFAHIIAENDYETANQLLEESLNVMKIIDLAFK